MVVVAVDPPSSSERRRGSVSRTQRRSLRSPPPAVVAVAALDSLEGSAASGGGTDERKLRYRPAQSDRSSPSVGTPATEGTEVEGEKANDVGPDKPGGGNDATDSALRPCP